MTYQEFNKKYKKYLADNFYGLAIADEEVVAYLDQAFQKIIKDHPNFEYEQIKMKWDSARVYTNMPQITDAWQKEIENIINKKPMNYIIVDLEATCWQGEKGKTNEIIEIGAVCVDGETKEITGEFGCFIKPKINPELSEFCKELTTITQEEVDEGMDFIMALNQFQEWIGEDYWLCSWGHYDKSQFTKDCQLHGVDTEWLTNHISVKHQFADFKGLKKACGMVKALKLEGLELDGTHHRGIDDARNIAKIFIKNFDSFTYE